MSTNYYFKIKDYENLIKHVKSLSNFILEDKVEDIFDGIHICKISCGWKPCFQKTQYYSNMEELIDFYIKYHKELVIIDEYDRVISWKSIYKEINICNKNKSHLNVNSTYTHIFYKDDFGFEWSNGEFS